MCNQQVDSLSHYLEEMHTCCYNQFVFSHSGVHCGFLNFFFPLEWAIEVQASTQEAFRVQPTSAVILEMTSFAAGKKRQWFICFLGSRQGEEGADTWGEFCWVMSHDGLGLHPFMSGMEGPGACRSSHWTRGSKSWWVRFLNSSLVSQWNCSFILGKLFIFLCPFCISV